MAADEGDVARLLAQFRAARRRFEERLGRIPVTRWTEAPAGASWSVRDLVAHIAAWLNEANDRVPRLLAGAPDATYDVDAFNAAAVERARDWSGEQAFGAFRRAADRYDLIVADLDPDDLRDCEGAMRWLRSVAGGLMDEHLDDLDRIVAPFAATAEEREA